MDERAERDKRTQRIIDHWGYFTIGALDPSNIGDVITDLVNVTDGTPVPYTFRVIGIGTIEEAKEQVAYVGEDSSLVPEFPYFYRLITD